MDQQPNVSLEDSTKPSKLMALIALVIAFALPFILVKSFPHKHKANYSHTVLSLPKLEDSPTIPAIAQQQIPAERTIASLITESQLRTADNTPAAILPVRMPTVIQKQNQASVAKPAALPAKNSQQTQSKPIDDWQIVKTKSGDSLAVIFKRVGISPQTLQTIIHDNPHTRVLTQIKPEQQLKFLVKKQILEQMMIPLTSVQDLLVYREGHHYKTKINSRKMDSHNQTLTATVRGSMYNTAKRNNIPYKLIQQMTEIFTWDINFAKDVRAGDQFTIIYKAFYIGDKLVETGDIVAVSYKSHGKTYQAVRHTDRTGHSDYYSPQGTSLKKAFERYPLRFSHISSTFSLSRYHPILHYRRPHKGVDLAAPIGTPIHATGDGHIEIIGRQSGYGNMIKINHNKNFSSVYGHMLRFQKGLSRGSFVKRGQIIGYVGQTGLASGPHCHYEFHINRQPKNPTTVDLPRGFPIPAREMASFKANSTTLLSQLKLFEQTHLAKR